MMTSFMIDVPSVSVDGLLTDCAHRRSLRRDQNWCAFVLHQEHHELGRRIIARISADDVHVIRSLVEDLAWPQCNRGAASDLHDDRAFKYVNQRLRMMRMHGVCSSGRVVDGDH